MWQACFAEGRADPLPLTVRAVTCTGGAGLALTVATSFAGYRLGSVLQCICLLVDVLREVLGFAVQDQLQMRRC